jgi:hypothetical protein
MREVHVQPRDDTDHPADAECPCDPITYDLGQLDGSVTRLYIHHPTRPRPHTPSGSGANYCHAQ